MASKMEPSVAPWKRELVQELKKKFEKYPVVGILDIEGIPAPQFQQMRELLRGEAEIKVGRRVLLGKAIEKRTEEEPEIEELKSYLEGPSALIFTEMDPFRLWKVLKENRTSAPAKVGMESPMDIIIPEGETEFDPGPIVGELQRAGVKARIQAGGVVVLEDSVIAAEGEEITEDEIMVMSRFGIEPREIGFELRAAYEEGIVFSEEMLRVDEEKVQSDVKVAFARSLRLSIGLQFPTRQNIHLLIGQAYSQAHGLAVGASVFVPETIPSFLGRAQSEMFGLASSLASVDNEAVGEELGSMFSAQAEAVEKEAEEEEEKPKEEAEEEEEEEEEVGEEEEEPGLGGLFD